MPKYKPLRPTGENIEAQIKRLMSDGRDRTIDDMSLRLKAHRDEVQNAANRLSRAGFFTARDSIKNVMCYRADAQSN